MTVSPFVPWPAGEVLLLASRSPRRAELLRVAGLPFEVRPAPEHAEDPAAALRSVGDDPAAYAVYLAGAKAEAVAAAAPSRWVLGADTIVVMDGEILEKPRDVAEARAMLRRLSARRHTVITAVALRRADAGLAWDAAERTGVEFLPLDDEAIAAYVDTGEPMDKAGAYGIQGFGAMMVRGVDGCYFNVMGLPLARLGAGLREVLEDRDGTRG